MEPLTVHGMTELDTDEMARVVGGDGYFKPEPDDVWSWLIETICGPMKHDPDIQVAEALP